MGDELKKIASLEALLFIYGEPLAIKKIAMVLAIDESLVEQLVTTLKKQYANEERGMTLFRDGDKIQLVTKPNEAAAIQALMKYEREEELTTAAIETLAIIAYRGPLERIAIDEIRGVNSAVTLRNLSLRGLIEKRRAENGGTTYAITGDCLKQLGLATIEGLPEYETHHKS